MESGEGRPYTVVLAKDAKRKHGGKGRSFRRA